MVEKRLESVHIFYFSVLVPLEQNISPHKIYSLNSDTRKCCLNGQIMCYVFEYLIYVNKVTSSSLTEFL